MIIQITKTRDELFLIKDMMPLWQKYADAFVFLDDRSTDGTVEFLNKNKDKYNILNVLQYTENGLEIESTTRQTLYDEAYKHSGKIICLDTDEYLDGTMTKQELNEILENNKDLLIHLQWVQYTDKNQIRIDGPWKYNLKDRVASYSTRGIFKPMQMHSEHLPVPSRQGVINAPVLFIAHLQWLDKPTVAVKQYYWKILDYITRNVYNAETIPSEAYDASVNNFNWEYASYDISLKVDPKIYDKHDIKNSFKYKLSKKYIEQYNIPNLNDWGMRIH